MVEVDLPIAFPEGTFIIKAKGRYSALPIVKGE